MLTLKVNQQSYQFANIGNDKTFYLEKINKYKQECGCSLGAIFMMSAVVVFSVHTFLIDWDNLDLLKLSLFGPPFILLFTAVGKFAGIGIARFKLKLLYEYLIQKRYLELIESR